MNKFSKAKKQKGIALLVVTMMIALLSTLVIQMTHSTFLQSRSLGMLERNVQAEYLLKSALNIAAAMIDQDQTPTYASYAVDTWGIFKSGAPIPQTMLSQLGINFLGLEMSVEIIPENAKLLITDQSMLAGIGTVANDIQYQIRSLFLKLDFDNTLLQKDHTGLTDKSYASADLVSNLIDYIDPDNVSFSPTTTLADGTQLPNGIESNLPKDYFPKNPDTKNMRMQELLIIPGMTPDRLKAIMPYARTTGADNKININVAPQIIIESINDQITPNIAQQIIAYRDQNQAFKNLGELNQAISINLSNSNLDVNTTRFEFIAKVRFGDTKAQYLKAIIDNTNKPPQISELTFY